MNAAQRAAAVTFRPLLEVGKRLDYAERIGITKSQAINEVLSLHLQQWLYAKRVEQAKDLKEALEAKIP